MEIDIYIVQDKPDLMATLDNEAPLAPIVTLKDPHGGIAHIIEDDHCYVLVLNAGRDDGRVVMTAWWFPEAFEAGRGLPALRAA